MMNYEYGVLVLFHFRADGRVLQKVGSNSGINLAA